MQDEVHNPLWKERVVFRENTDEVFAVDIYIEAGGDPQAPEHVHPSRDERARLVAGSARLILDGEEKSVAAGDVVTRKGGTGTTAYRASWTGRSCSPRRRTSSWPPNRRFNPSLSCG